MRRRPGARLYIEPIGTHHHDSRHLLALVARQLPGRHRRQPDVGVQSHLMAGMPGKHWSAARLRHVADQYARPARILACLRGQPFDQCDHIGMGPVTIARQPHHLPIVAVDRQSLRARDAAMGIEPVHACRHRRRQHLAAEQFLGGDFGIVGVGERRQRFRVDRALVLRPRACGVDGGHYGDERDQNQARVHRITLFMRNVA